ncbi:MAG: hypothetical protein FWG64_14740 [Firmicutes bacterium]|nr:hypothetical protein [Bacillota bacterium]
MENSINFNLGFLQFWECSIIVNVEKLRTLKKLQTLKKRANGDVRPYNPIILMF